MSRRAFTLATVLGLGLGLGLGLAGGCADLDGDGGGEPLPPARAAEPGAAAALERGPATYTVPLPVELAELRAVASFAVPAARVERDGDRVAVIFTLPAGLLGVDAEVRVEGVQQGDHADVDGALGAGTCWLGRAVRCDLAYRPLVYSVDLDAVARYWRDRGDAAIDGRLIVSSLFDDDPLGVLELSLD